MQTLDFSLYPECPLRLRALAEALYFADYALPAPEAAAAEEVLNELEARQAWIEETNN